MGYCAEKTAKEFSITRAMQDEYCFRSYERAELADQTGIFREEITPIDIKGKIVDKDEEP